MNVQFSWIPLKFSLQYQQPLKLFHYITEIAIFVKAITGIICKNKMYILWRHN